MCIDGQAGWLPCECTALGRLQHGALTTRGRETLTRRMVSRTCTSALMVKTILVRSTISNTPSITSIIIAHVCRMSSDENVFPVWDFHEIAGMTAELEMPLLTCDGEGGSDYNRWPQVMNYTKEVGGVSDGISGASAMNLSAGTLHHVQNFWAFADDFFLHLGASPCNAQHKQSM